jgi:hypothetical protein
VNYEPKTPDNLYVVQALACIREVRLP